MTTKKQFFDLRKQQIIKDHHRPVTAYDDQASEAVWAVAQGAGGNFGLPVTVTDPQK